MMQQHLACCAIETYPNGWTTAGRMQSDDMGCIFGCAGRPDALLHYLFCPSFNFALGAAWGPHPPGEAFDDAISRIGLPPAVPQRAAAMFLLYHSSRAAPGPLTPPRLLELVRAALREARIGMSD